MNDDHKPDGNSAGSSSRPVAEASTALRPAPKRLEKLPPGELLEGKYLIRSSIGEGGMGVVYEAEHVALGLVMAVKVLHPSEPDAPHVIERFKTEARSAANIRHPNVVEVTDFGLTSDLRPFFVMEHLAGESLAQRLERDKKLPERTVVEIADQILSGLSSAHRRGVIHRDLKPENVFLSRTEGLGETVKLLDFGVARIIGGREPEHSATDDHSPMTSPAGKPLTQYGIVLGTPGYLAPETARGAPADHRSDLFSVGVILYEMLIGQRPFRGDTIEKIISATLSSPVPRPALLRPDLSPAMERLVLTALAKSPSDRFQSAEEFLRQLSAAAVGRIPDDARPCLTETSTPTSILPVAEPLPMIPGDQETIETLDSIPASGIASSDPPPAAVLTPSPSPAAPWTGTPRSDAPASRPPSGRVRRIALLAGIAAAVIACLIALVFLVLFSLGIDPLATSAPNPAVIVGDDRESFGGDTSAVETTTIWIEVSPLMSTITWDGRVVTDRPLVVPRGEKELEMLISHPGYMPERLMIRPNEERTIRVNLHKL